MTTKRMEQLNRICRIIRLYEAGENMKEIAYREGISTAAVARHLRRNAKPANVEPSPPHAQTD